MFDYAQKAYAHMQAHPDAISAASLPKTRFIANRVQITDFHQGINIAQACKIIQMTIRDIRDLIMAIAAHIETISKAKLVHRDIKPENIILRQAENFSPENVKVIDMDFFTSMDQTEPKWAIGTPLFIAPERIPRHPKIFSGDSAIDGKNMTPGKCDTTSDFHSLGFVAYELFPFTFHEIVSPLEARGNFDIGELFRAKINGTFFYPDAMERMERYYMPRVRPPDRPGTRAIFQTILALAEPDPKKRPQSVEEIGEMLKEKGTICDYEVNH